MTVEVFDTAERFANASYAAVVVFERLDPLAVELYLRASSATRREIAHRFLRADQPAPTLLAEKIIKYARYFK
jgi:hypothetical protein